MNDLDLRQKIEELRNVSVDEICEERDIPYWKRWMASNLKHAVKPENFKVLTSDISIDEMAGDLGKSRSRVKVLRSALINEGLTKPRSKTAKQYVKKKEVTDISISIDPHIVRLFTLPTNYPVECFFKMKNNPEVIVTGLLLSLEEVSSRKIANYLIQNYGIKVSHITISNWNKKYDYLKPLLRYLKESFESERSRILGEEQDWMSYSWEETLKNLSPEFMEYMPSKIETLEDIITELGEVKPTISPDLKEVPTIPTLEAEIEVKETIAPEIRPNILEVCRELKLNYFTVRDLTIYLADRGSIDEREFELSENEGIKYMRFIMGNFEALCERMNLDTPYKNIKLERDSRTGIYNLKAT